MSTGFSPSRTGITKDGNTADVSNQGALRTIPPDQMRTAFGEFAVGEPHPLIQIKFPYGLNSGEIESHPNNLGTVTVVDSMLTCSTGASANSRAVAHSREIIAYRAGQGVKARFTTKFTAGAANSIQLVGAGHEGEAVGVGFDGTANGVLHRHHGSVEVRTLTINTASTTDEDITVTIDGNADATVTVTNTGNKTITANEIAAHDFSDLGPGWHTHAFGDTVIFKSFSATVQTGTYSIAGATAVGTFAQTVAGVVPTDDWIPQASWNGPDRFDGSGVTGIDLDPTKGNVFEVKFKYLGYGPIKYFYEENPPGKCT